MEGQAEDACLGIPPLADEATIRKTYKRLALELHPDKVPESDCNAATERFQELGAALSACIARLALKNSGELTSLDDWELDPEAEGQNNFCEF
ncbi:hypothetical protein P154DRAFT_582582 [Amniculicola lignicola CBS 123094]|uniref:J domain-containing protein n=1 Tax=Amniculicola lignicola CBS 123094 TaxID=1392246 RepID=A0A6A5W7R3_9PLEO|nr:hypothetical protein P154DRAFT_582582 [Amniculicola lignicola CBS 123094]